MVFMTGGCCRFIYLKILKTYQRKAENKKDKGYADDGRKRGFSDL